MDFDELSKMYDFTGMSVTITGGAGILGGELACALVGMGANVAVLEDLRLRQEHGKAPCLYAHRQVRVVVEVQP